MYCKTRFFETRYLAVTWGLHVIHDRVGNDLPPSSTRPSIHPSLSIAAAAEGYLLIGSNGPRLCPPRNDSALEIALPSFDAVQEPDVPCIHL